MTTLLTSAIATVWVVGASAQATRHVIRDPNGAAACVITIPVSRPGLPDEPRLAIDIRVPSTPDVSVLGRLPVDRRDFTVLPIRVLLVPTPGYGLSPTAVSRVKPVSLDFTPRRLGLDSREAADTFVRVEFPRAELKVGVDVVAERSAAASSGERITSQTRCRISAADANVWR